MGSIALADKLEQNPDRNIPDNKIFHNAFPNVINYYENYYWYLLCERDWKNILNKISNKTNSDKYIICRKLYSFMKKYNLCSCVDKLFELTEIDLSSKKLIYIPSELGQLNNLQELYLTHNQFSSSIKSNTHLFNGS